MPSQQHSVTAFCDHLAMETVGSRVRKQREAQGLSRPELSKRTGIGYSTIAELERGGMQTSTKLREIAEALNVNLLWLETGKGPIEPRISPSVSQPSRLDPVKIREAHESIRAIYEDQGRHYDIEAEPELFVTVYERLVSITGRPSIVEMARIGRVIERRQQGAEDEGDERSERVGGAHSGKGKTSAAG